MEERVDVYDASRRRTGRVRRRGEAMKPGEYGLVVCVWVCDGAGHLLLTKRAPEKKSFPNTWENSGGSAWAGESSRQAIARELYEETGIRAREEAFLLLESDRGEEAFFDFYFLRCPSPRPDIVLQPGETSDARWVTLDEVREMIRAGLQAAPIARRFRLQEARLEQLVGTDAP